MILYISKFVQTCIFLDFENNLASAIDIDFITRRFNEFLTSENDFISKISQSLKVSESTISQLSKMISLQPSVIALNISFEKQKKRVLQKILSIKKLQTSKISKYQRQLQNISRSAPSTLDFLKIDLILEEHSSNFSTTIIALENYLKQLEDGLDLTQPFSKVISSFEIFYQFFSDFQRDSIKSNNFPPDLYDPITKFCVDEKDFSLNLLQQIFREHQNLNNNLIAFLDRRHDLLKSKIIQENIFNDYSFPYLFKATIRSTHDFPIQISLTPRVPLNVFGRRSLFIHYDELCPSQHDGFADQNMNFMGSPNFSINSIEKCQNFASALIKSLKLSQSLVLSPYEIQNQLIESNPEFTRIYCSAFERKNPIEPKYRWYFF